MNSTAAAGNHFRSKTPGWKPYHDLIGSQQVFLQNDSPTGEGLDITSFMGGKLYVAGWGAIPEELPEDAGSVKAQPAEIAQMVKLAKEYLQVDAERDLDIFKVGRCYRPLAEPNHPIITKVDWNLIKYGTHQDFGLQVQSGKPTFDRKRADASTVGGLFINTAHYSDGVTFSMGSGRVMSELLLGLLPSIDVSGFGLE